MDQLSGVLRTTNGAAWEAANPGRRHDAFGDGAWDAPEQREKRELFSASLELNHVFGDVTFNLDNGVARLRDRAARGPRRIQQPRVLPASSNPEQSDFFSQELRFTGESERLKWTAGATYTNGGSSSHHGCAVLVGTFESSRCHRCSEWLSG
ncbi:MAG: hypothetical protein IPF57_24705 [Gammaproteobacteria bacterium]|nr:hypothetical protein [Gammaproteobacteria bacterium]